MSQSIMFNQLSKFCETLCSDSGAMKLGSWVPTLSRKLLPPPSGRKWRELVHQKLWLVPSNMTSYPRQLIFIFRFYQLYSCGEDTWFSHSPCVQFCHFNYQNKQNIKKYVVETG
jgi:hypothetical protein